MRWLPLLLVLLATPALASPLDRLRTENLLASTRDQLVQEACALPEITAEQLAPVFAADRRPAQLDAARIAVCREDPALVPLMFSEFARSTLGSERETDPDVFERLLRGMQQLPFEQVREQLLTADHDVLIDAIHARFFGDWVLPLSPELEAAPPKLSPEQRALVQEPVRQWLSQLLDAGETGLIWLQTDSGGALTALQLVLQDAFVTALVEHGTPEEKRVGAELRRQLPELPQNLLPDTSRLYRVDGPVTADLPDGDWLIAPPGRPLHPAVLPTLLALLAFVGWVAALRRWPESRRVLFPAGALLLGLLAVLALEGLFALVGVRPLNELRPTLDPNSVGGSYPTVELEGQPHVVSGRGGHRYEAFVVPKPDGVRRVIALGESSVHGTHYLREETFVSRLDAALGPDVEVLNAGLGGALSDEIMRSGLEALTWDPDLLILYFGYNDLTHIPYMDRYRGIDLKGLRTRRELGRWRLVRVLHDLVPTPLLDLPQRDPATLEQQEQTTEQALELTDFARINASANMVKLALAARDAGVDVLLVGQATNEAACPPGVTDRADLLERGCHRDELAAIGLDVARQTGLPLLDTATLMREIQASRATASDPQPWQDLFWDGVHPTRLGHAVLADAIAPHAQTLLDP